MHVLCFKGRAVETALSLDEGLKAVVPLQSIDRIQDKLHDKLVHLTGHLRTDMVRYVLNISFLSQLNLHLPLHYITLH